MYVNCHARVQTIILFPHATTFDYFRAYRQMTLIIAPVGGDEAANMNGTECPLWHMFDIFPEKC